jgi:hypothetical protein
MLRTELAMFNFRKYTSLVMYEKLETVQPERSARNQFNFMIYRVNCMAISMGYVCGWRKRRRT